MRFMNKIPGGAYLVPMLFMSLVATIAPGFINMGGFTSALFSSESTNFVIAVLIFIAGVQFDIRDFVPAMKRGGALSLARILIGVLVEVIVLKIFGTDGFLGVSALAIVITMVSCNPGVYLAVSQEYGDKYDIPGFGIMNLVPVPAIPILMLGFAAGVSVDYMSLVTTIIPFILGMIFGNLDKELGQTFAMATPVFTIALGLTCGASMNWVELIGQIGGGVLLTVIYFVISIPWMLLVDKGLLRRPGYAAVSMTSMSGVSIIMPAAVAAAIPAYEGYAVAAAAQIGLAVALTDIISPFLINMAIAKWGSSELHKA
jgi:2-keto-3-deoxygluconate permease